MAFCTACGAGRHQTDAFCRSCGHQHASTASTPDVTVEPAPVPAPRPAIPFGAHALLQPPAAGDAVDVSNQSTPDDSQLADLRHAENATPRPRPLVRFGSEPGDDLDPPAERPSTEGGSSHGSSRHDHADSTSPTFPGDSALSKEPLAPHDATPSLHADDPDASSIALVDLRGLLAHDTADPVSRMCPYCLTRTELDDGGCTCGTRYHADCYRREGGCIRHDCDAWRLAPLRS